MSEPDGECARCKTPLYGQEHTGLPAYDYPHFMEDNPDGDRYCSARCIERTAAERMHRRKHIIRTGPGFGEIQDEKWPRFTAEVPPEIATLLDTVQRKHLGVNASAASRAGMVRAGLLLYLERAGRVQEPTINVTATEDAGELPQ